MPTHKKNTKGHRLKQSTLLQHLGRESSPTWPGSSSQVLHAINPNPATSPTQTKGQRRTTSQYKMEASNSIVTDSDSDVDEIALQPRAPTPEDNLMDDSPRTPKGRKRRRVVSDPEEESDDEAPAQPRPPKGGERSRRKQRIALESEGEGTISSESSPRRRKLVKGVRPPTPEEEDLTVELDQDKIIEPRMRSRNKRSTYLENLEKLKRRKQGQPEQSSASDSEDNDSDSEDTGGGAFKPIKGARPSRSESHISIDDEDEEDEDNFVVADDDTAVPTELPAAFSMNTHQDLSHHFKIICQFFVHLALQPAEQRDFFVERVMQDEEYFAVPLQVVRRKLDGLRDSAVTSSVWKSDFKRPLETLPNLELYMLEFAIPECDACNLGSRVSTRCAKVTGAPYDKSTYESLSNDSSDSSSDSEADSDDPEKAVSFNLGRFCARRTKVFHEFNHWEYHLYRAITQEIDPLRQKSKRKRGFVRVAYAGGKQPPDDLDDADAVCQWLDERGIISMEWKKMQDMMESARTLEIKGKDGEDD